LTGVLAFGLGTVVAVSFLAGAARLTSAALAWCETGVQPVRTRAVALLLVTLAAAASCSAQADRGDLQLAPRGQILTKVKPTRQDLANRLSLTGKVTMNPVFGVASPIAGEVRFATVKPAKSVPVTPTKVASVLVKKVRHDITVPAGATMVARLVEDRSAVSAGMPVASAKLAGYGIIADIDGAQAYRISDALASVQAQIKNGPGPFACGVVGTIAALPAGTVPAAPEQPAHTSAAAPSTAPGALPDRPAEKGGAGPSEATGLRLVCTPPANVKLINGVDATLEVVTGRASNALVVPVEAVAGLAGRGRVDVVGPDKTRQTRDVVLGLTDGKVVEIKSGLTGTEELAVPGPNLPMPDAPKNEGR
jgi:hypothetical protein